MIQYFDDLDLACIDGYSFRRDKKTNYFLSSKSIGKKRIRLHIYIWTRANGEIAKGMQVHHVDGNKLNNNLDNLSIMTASEHLKHHRSILNEDQKQTMKKNLLMYAVPASKEWHGSEAGRKWHSEHAKKVFGNMELIEYICTQCDSKFLSKKKYKDSDNRFCTNACKSAFRRDAGYDDITKVCTICGGEFIDNKYRKTKKCKSCRR